MTTYYTFQNPVLSSAPMDVTHRIPDAKFASTLIEDIQAELSVPREPVHPQCCTLPPPCKTWIQFKPELSDCPTTYMSWKEATNGKVSGFEVGQKDSRIWVGSLNPMHYRRGQVSGALWPAESTQGHIRDRQLFAQYLQSTLYENSSPDLKRIDRIQDSYGAMVHRGIPIQYTSF